MPQYTQSNRLSSCFCLCAAGALFIASNLGFAQEASENPANQNVTPSVIDQDVQSDPLIVDVDEYEIDYKDKKNADVKNCGPIFLDVLKHSKRGIWAPKKGVFSDPLSPGTIGHETLHHINADLVRRFQSHPDYQNHIKYRSYSGREFGVYGIEALYLGDGKAAIVKTPRNFEIKDIAAIIPTQLRGGVFDTYFTRPMRANSQNNGVPIYKNTYILDEASAYAMDAMIAMELHDYHEYYTLKARQGQKIAETQGSGEFIAYVLALGHKIETTPSAYADPQDKERMYSTLKYLVERLASNYKAGLDTKKYPVFSNGYKDSLDILRTDPRADKLRSFAVEAFGQQWLDDILSPSVDHEVTLPKGPLSVDEPKAEGTISHQAVMPQQYALKQS